MQNAAQKSLVPKICPRCQALYPASFTICPEHGCLLVEAGRSLLVMPGRKRRRWLLPALGLALLLLAVAVLAALLIFSLTGK